MEEIINFILTVLFGLLLLSPVLYFILKKDKEYRSMPARESKPDKGYSPAHLARLHEVRRVALMNGDSATVQAVDTMTYNGHLPVRKPDGTFTSIDSTIVDYNIAGINFRSGIARYEGPFMGCIRPEPSNAYDQNAIAIYHEDEKHLDYIPADETDDVRALSLPISIWGEIEKDYDFDERRTFYRGTIYLELPKVSPQNL